MRAPVVIQNAPARGFGSTFLSAAIVLGRSLALMGVLVRFAWRARGRYGTTASKAFAMARQLRSEGVGPSPLIHQHADVYRIDPAWLAARMADTAPRSAASERSTAKDTLVVHFTGTGETRHGPIASLLRALEHSPELALCDHFVADAPSDAGAYLSPRAFGETLWQQLEPIIDRHPGPFLFIGLSRGALAALELGNRVASNKGKLTRVVAYSPPFIRPSELPPSIELIGSLEALVEHSSALLAHPRLGFFRTHYARISQPVQTFLTALVLSELGLGDDDNMRWAMCDVVSDDPLTASLRSVREFAMLTRVPQSELEQFAAELGAAFAKPTLLSAVVLWGEDDPWTPAVQNQALVVQALARAGASSQALHHALVPAAGHALCRQPEVPAAALAVHLAGVMARVMGRTLSPLDDAPTGSDQRLVG